jgi:serine/threonine-protein kinase
MTVGTVAYAAPEQLMGEQMDGRADQYALAATVYHLLSGVQLFPNSNPAVVISRHLNMPPPKLGDRRPDCAFLDDVLQVALAKNPQDRFPSCSAFAMALADESAGQGGASANASTQAAPKPRKSTPTSPKRSPAKPAAASRRAWVVLGGVASIILLVGVVTLAWRPWDSQRSNSAGATSTLQATSTNQPAPSPSVAMSPAPTVEPTKSDTTTPAVPTAGFFGEWGQHSMSVTLAPDGSAHYAVWSGVANGTSWSATWSAMTSTTAMVVVAKQLESHGDTSDGWLDRYPGEAFTFTLRPDGYATITTPP